MENNEQRQQTGMNRRSFLKVGAAATTMGVIGAIKAPAKVANAAETMNYVPGPTNARSKLRPVHDFAGAKVRFVENNDEWLGTTKIISKVKRLPKPMPALCKRSEVYTVLIPKEVSSNLSLSILLEELSAGRVTS